MVGRPLKRRGRLFCAIERFVLGAAMTVVAFVIERRLLKAIKEGAVEPAPRTAAEMEEDRQGELTTAPHEVRDQAGG
jgi:hypothetical protein